MDNSDRLSKLNLKRVLKTEVKLKDRLFRHIFTYRSRFYSSRTSILYTISVYIKSF